MPRVFSHPLLVRPHLTSCGDGAQEGSNLRMRRAVARRWHGGLDNLVCADSATIGGVAGDGRAAEKSRGGAA
ncbi:hypothetical protein THAOC_21802 [Thalassiosira oceanica]|uniref:Uncharacterized protein n=1 Tax=Thalassiosira oceanica TaxID=159749 RepID=K0RWC2_THAOC|nr:hypothetical protein THAOC_21802 [Thalassiosira oceanica]|eukprot:EJK58098.1 hypothetical protein THAOC_21802 [Thalassiosira oceanica]